VSVAILARLSEGKGDAAIVGSGELAVGERGAGAVLAEPGATFPVRGTDAQVGVEVEAEDLGERRGEELVPGEAGFARVEMARALEAAGHELVSRRGLNQALEGRRLAIAGGDDLALLGHQPAAAKEGADASDELGHDAGDVVVVGSGGLVEDRGAVAFASIHAVNGQGMKVDVEAQRRRVPLDEGDGPAPGGTEASSARAGAHPGEDDADEAAVDGGEERRIGGEKTAQIKGQRKGPQAQGRFRENAVYQTSGRGLHPLSGT
jgi:hypothetical protein